MQVAKKKGKETIVRPTDAFPDATPGARGSRTVITSLYSQFIDEYLPTYTALSGQATARDNLVNEIMKAASTRSALMSEGVPQRSVKKRLGNALAKKNRKEKLEAEEEEEE